MLLLLALLVQQLKRGLAVAAVNVGAAAEVAMIVDWLVLLLLLLLVVPDWCC